MKKTFRIIGLLLLACAALAGWVTLSHGHPGEVRGERQLRVMTYNTLMMGRCRPADSNEIVQYILSHPADIVCLQEVELRKDRNHLTMLGLKEALCEEYPYTYFDFKIYNNYRQYGNAVFSRYPLINKKTVRYESKTNISSRCDVVVGDDTIRLITNHLESNKILASDWADSLNTDAVRQSAQRIGHKLLSAGSLRRSQVRMLRREVEDSPYPIIVAGDLNSIPLSRTYLSLRRVLRDCFLDGSRWKTGATLYLPMNLPFKVGVRIDYILVSPNLHTVESHVDRTTDASDHYPLRATVSW